jgi:hypothetical protein
MAPQLFGNAKNLRHKLAAAAGAVRLCGEGVFHWLTGFDSAALRRYQCASGANKGFAGSTSLGATGPAANLLFF